MWFSPHRLRIAEQTSLKKYNQTFHAWPRFDDNSWIVKVCCERVQEFHDALKRWAPSAGGSCRVLFVARYWRIGAGIATGAFISWFIVLLLVDRFQKCGYASFPAYKKNSVGSVMFIPDPGSRIQDQKIPDLNFNQQNTDEYYMRKPTSGPRLADPG